MCVNNSNTEDAPSLPMMTTFLRSLPRLFIAGCILLISNHRLVHSWSSPAGAWCVPSCSSINSAATTSAINTWQSFPRSSRRRRSSITPISSRTATTTSTTLWDSQWEKDIEAGTRRRVQTGQTGSGTSETVAGAVLGGLLLGPFGALFGASIGSSLGGKNAVQKARQQELERLGITQEMLDSAQDIGVALERSLQGLKTVQESLDTQQRLARRLDAECNDLYDKAKNFLTSGKEDEARQLLLKRTRVQEQLKQALQNCALAKKQQTTLEENARRLEQRAMEIDTLLRRASGAKAMQDSALATTGRFDNDDVDFGLSLRDSDPLLRKFKDMGID
jgi:hypothetical protein